MPSLPLASGPGGEDVNTHVGFPALRRFDRTPLSMKAAPKETSTPEVVDV